MRREVCLDESQYSRDPVRQVDTHGDPNHDPCHHCRQGGLSGGPPDRPARRSCAGARPPPRQVAERVPLLARAGVGIFPGDMDSPESIDQAMRGVSRVALVTQPVLPQELSAIDSSGSAGFLGRRTGSFEQFAVDYAQAFS
jgi:hypothetical protein